MQLPQPVHKQVYPTKKTCFNVMNLEYRSEAKKKNYFTSFLLLGLVFL